MGGRARSCGAVILLAIVCSCRGVTLESIHWSSSNSKFTPGQGLVLYPQIGDKMDIVCPRADPSSGRTEEFYKVYLPDQDVKFTFKFQEFSPNLWGLEFLKGKDYYITSTSTGSLRGLDNTKGGVCRTKSMKLVLRVGQSKQHAFILVFTNKDVHTHIHARAQSRICAVKRINGNSCFALKGYTGENQLISLSLLLVIVVVLVVLWRYYQRRRVPDRQRQQQHQPPASVSLSTLAVPKRDSFSSDNDGSDRSEVVFPLRPSESVICRHYERVSGEYGPPVYIVQEIMPQSPTNVYYKV
uniref:Ephrin RBD domain-containing protein n=1 Tax=Xiphophorus couchianus TaxID=32473 RepID=A0A3B5KU83_9TELE